MSTHIVAAVDYRDTTIVVMDLRSCLLCNVDKSRSEFYRQPRRKDGLFPYCKTCSNDKSAKWRRDNPEGNKAIAERSRDKHRVTSKTWRMKSHYGITGDDYLRMLQSQGGKCGIPSCGKTIISALDYTGRKLKDVACIDHDHVTGRVRGLLCNRCNYVVGCVEKHGHIIDGAGEYLRRSSC